MFKESSKLCSNLEWASNCCLMLIINEQFFIYIYIMTRISYIQWNDDGVCFVLDQHTSLDLNSAISLKQQSVGKYAAPLQQIILILSQPVWILSGEEASNTNFIVFGLTKQWIEPTIYQPIGMQTHNYTTNAI